MGNHAHRQRVCVLGVVGSADASIAALGLVGIIGAGFGALAGYRIYHLATGRKK